MCKISCKSNDHFRCVYLFVSCAVISKYTVLTDHFHGFATNPVPKPVFQTLSVHPEFTCCVACSLFPPITLTLDQPQIWLYFLICPFFWRYHSVEGVSGGVSMTCPTSIETVAVMNFRHSRMRLMFVMFLIPIIPRNPNDDDERMTTGQKSMRGGWEMSKLHLPGKPTHSNWGNWKLSSQSKAPQAKGDGF